VLCLLCIPISCWCFPRRINTLGRETDEGRKREGYWKVNQKKRKVPLICMLNNGRIFTKIMIPLKKNFLFFNPFFPVMKHNIMNWTITLYASCLMDLPDDRSDCYRIFMFLLDLLFFIRLFSTSKNTTKQKQKNTFIFLFFSVNLQNIP